MKKTKSFNKQPTQFGAFLALTKASLISTLRNPMLMFFNFAFPFIFIVIFGIIGQGDLKFEVAVDQNSIKSGEVYEALQKN